MSDFQIHDVTIIGGGPAGLYTAFYCGMRALDTHIIEAQPDLGGKIHAYPEKIVWDVGGLPPSSGKQLMDQLVAQAETFRPAITTNEKIIHVEKDEDGLFRLEAETGGIYYSRSVIVAVGHGILHAQKLDIEGAEKFELSNLHYTVQHLERFRNQRVIISGGGNSAVDWANALCPIASEVTVVHRRDEFGGHERHVQEMKDSEVNVQTPFALSGLRGNDAGTAIEKVLCTNLDTDERVEKEVDAVIVNHGFQMEFELLENLQLQTEENKILVNERMGTNIEGLFAAGDITSHHGKVHLIAGAFVEGASAANSVKQYLEPGAGAKAMVSSHNERFAEKNQEIQKNLLSKQL
ncbi:thioredoxin reductase [Marinococcus halophilus]|uniref:Ferredoxin--NADP reductase n=1 Tax=Marinococcus halophilus TaxID=1371 RepID=A0A510Y6M1_MARHA|nr:NAD(P)/FAD-dependent oxidoreductase [Marinococcus halophilus]OZT80635.1 thioredoxin reductase [Marinococcus halophilus]GEK58995.1 ferredoxin--NADP reductase 1 [Marinococcus halophilus]